MKDKIRSKNYKVKGIRVDDETWEAFKKQREEMGLSWNLYLWKLMGKEKPYSKKKQPL